MTARNQAVISATIAGALSALLVAQSGASFKLVAVAFAVTFLKDLGSVFTPAPGQKAGA